MSDPLRADQALADIQTYVAACQAVARPRITAERVRELYSAGDGLQLSALDADSAALGAAAAAAEDALSAERAAVIELEQSWRGGSGSAATDFLARQCAAGSGVADGLAAAAAVLRSLRSRIAELTDARHDATVRIGDRRAAERPAWLARARAVLAGVADDSALDTVRREIAPFVEVDVAGDWAATMAALTDAVNAAYRTAAGDLDELPVARFEVPVAARPVAAQQSGQVAAPQTAPQAAPVADAPPVPASTPMPAIPGMGNGPGIGSGLGLSPALPGQGGTGVAEPAPVESPRPRKRMRQHADHDDADLGQPPSGSDEGADQVTDESADEVTAGDADQDAPDPIPGAPVEPPAAAGPLPAPPVETQSPPPAPLPAEAGFQPRTPCEIAADELPQVGQ